ncbi:glycoside hydrolase family 13 protein [Marinicrinis sediminis]|uniref:oligo-1,6-glucosidase n=1 Tax=Marinicrinis sediminis TaxID=1652465 RepID=A0ABW5RAM6_9BACL
MQKTWWKESVVYQIYPRSFMDSNGDGIGDLNGIRSKLDYLKELGVDVIWICPIYQSPNADNGYDISDYYEIMDEFGTMEQFDALLAEAHERGLRVIMDLVVNHTSDEHPWFIESRSSTDHPKRDYYIWRKGKQSGDPQAYPNNWESVFGHSVWQYDEETDEFFMHIFTNRQPDLNWENPRMVQDIHEMIRWWLDKGIDGFRVDAINHITREEGLPDEENPQQLKTVPAYKRFANLPGVHDHIRHIHEQVLRHYDIMTVGEAGGSTPEDALLYVGEDRHELNMSFHFEHMGLDRVNVNKWVHRPWQLSELKSVMSRWQEVLHGKGWNANYWNNHDQPRAVSRFGEDTVYRKPSAKLLATFIHMLEGTPFVYQGEEIGMTNIRFQDLSDYRDIEIFNYARISKEKGMPEQTMMEAIWRTGRDNARTPMQWNATENGGFTTGTPWMKVNPNYTTINVEESRQDPNSIFHYYQKLIRLRKQHEVIVYGKYELIEPDHAQVYAFTRTFQDQQLLVILNFSEEQAEFELPDSVIGFAGEWLIGNYEHDTEPMTGKNGKLPSRSLRLLPYEAQVYLGHSKA